MHQQAKRKTANIPENPPVQAGKIEEEMITAITMIEKEQSAGAASGTKETTKLIGHQADIERSLKLLENLVDILLVAPRGTKTMKTNMLE